MKLTLLHIAMVVFGMMMAMVATAAPGELPPAPVQVSYKCQLIIVAKDLPNGSAVFAYDVTPENNVGHGGAEFPFTSGSHKITVLSNGRWLGLSWWRDGKLVSEAVFARSEDNMGSQALIVYNPADPEEQTSVDCTKH